MSWKTEARKIYETRVVADSLAQLAKRFDLKSLPFSDEELQTLAIRARQSFRSEKKREQLERYKARLAALYGEERVGAISAALEDINQFNSRAGFEPARDQRGCSPPLETPFICARLKRRGLLRITQLVMRKNDHHGL